MKLLYALFSILFISTSLKAQWGYEAYSKTDGLEISTKWGHARDHDGKRKPALLFRIENQNEHAVEFRFDLNFYYEGILRETGGVDNECIDGLKSRVGRLNGIYFVPEKFTPEQLIGPDFHFSVDEIEVNRVSHCGAEDEDTDGMEEAPSEE